MSSTPLKNKSMSKQYPPGWQRWYSTVQVKGWRYLTSASRLGYMGAPALHSSNFRMDNDTLRSRQRLYLTLDTASTNDPTRPRISIPSTGRQAGVDWTAYGTTTAWNGWTWNGCPSVDHAPRCVECMRTVHIARVVVGLQTTTHPLKLHLRVGRGAAITTRKFHFQNRV